MNQVNRILLNTCATYGRSLIALFCGLFSARWILAALGHSDFGLYGVVGGMVAFISFLNTVLASSVARFYAYSIGIHRDQNGRGGGVDIKRWFNAALLVHLSLALLIPIVAYPFCDFAIIHWLTVPPDRVSACRLVLLFSMASTMLSFVSIPYIAMYTAHQLIAELTVFDLIRIGAMFLGSYSMLHWGGDRLLAYGALMSGSVCVILVLQIMRARRMFKACHFDFALFKDFVAARELGKYAIWKAFGVLGWSIRQHGSTFAVNVFFGAKANAALAIANQFASQAASLSSSLMTALVPALTAVSGGGDVKKTRTWTLSACKYPAALLVMIGTPLMFEIDNVLKLWLNDPPEGSDVICLWIIAALVVSNMTSGYCAALSALENIKHWQICESVVMVLFLPFLIGLYLSGFSFTVVGFSLFANICLIGGVRFWFGKRLIGIGVKEWIKGVFLKVLLMWGCVAVVCHFLTLVLPPSLGRIIITGGSSSVVSCFLILTVCMEKSERQFCVSMIKRRIHNV